MLKFPSISSTFAFLVDIYAKKMKQSNWLFPVCNAHLHFSSEHALPYNRQNTVSTALAPPIDGFCHKQTQQSGQANLSNQQEVRVKQDSL